MTLEDFFATLSYGELSALKISTNGSGSIAEGDENKVIGMTNSALTALYARFSHKVNYVTLTLDDEIHEYHLTSDYAVSNVDPDNDNPRYITDTALEPFQDTLTKVIGALQLVSDVDECELDLSLNDTSKRCTVKTMDYNTLYFAAPKTGRKILIEYMSKHPKLLYDVPLEAQEIDLAPALHEALELYVSSRVFLSIGGEMNILRSNALKSRYEEICLRAESRDTLQTSETDNHDKLTEGGFI